MCKLQLKYSLSKCKCKMCRYKINNLLEKEDHNPCSLYLSKFYNFLNSFFLHFLSSTLDPLCFSVFPNFYYLINFFPLYNFCFRFLMHQKCALCQTAILSLNTSREPNQAFPFVIPCLCFFQIT